MSRKDRGGIRSDQEKRHNGCDGHHGARDGLHVDHNCHRDHGNDHEGCHADHGGLGDLDGLTCFREGCHQKGENEDKDENDDRRFLFLSFLCFPEAFSMEEV